MAAIWLGAMFWVGLAIDYLPVLLGASEMPWNARLNLLLLVAAVLLYITLRWILSRLLVRMSDRSMALLMERQFGVFHDSLVTVVELAGHRSDASDVTQKMLFHSEQHALQQLRKVRLAEIFNLTPLARKMGVVAVLGASLFGLDYVARDSLDLAFRRLYLLSSDDWPRRAEIMIDGFRDGRLKVARGSNVSLRVFAMANKHVPDYCTVYYHTEQGDRGRVHMRRRGRVHRGRQEFIYDGVPFKSILSNVRFDVLGFDHRLKDHQLQVVDSPSLTDVQLDCTFPDYLVDEELGIHLPRTERLTPGTRLPTGTRILIRATADKPLTHIELLDTTTGNLQEWSVAGNTDSSAEFTYEIRELVDDVAFAVTLHDVDGVSNKQPFRIMIGAVRDAVPQVAVNLQGIGNAATPQAMIPIQGRITDDNALEDAWFHLRQIMQPADAEDAEQTDQNQNGTSEDAATTVEHKFPITLWPGAEQQHSLDLREQQRDPTRRFQLQAGQRVVLMVRATDRYDLDDKPHVGSSDPFGLEIVTADQLISRLETAEISLRRRLQQVVEELHGTRDSVIRVRSSFDDGSSSDEDGAEPGDEEAVDAKALQRSRSLRLLRVHRAAQDVLRSKEEVYGIGLAFDDIRAELINNRVDTTERIEHIQREIADPLKEIARAAYPLAVQTLEALESALDETQRRVTLAESAVGKMDEILLDLEHILKQVLDLESYNELIDIVRSIIDDQDRLIEETEKQRDVQGIELLK